MKTIFCHVPLTPGKQTPYRTRLKYLIFVVCVVLSMAKATLAQTSCVMCTTPDSETSEGIRYSVLPGYNKAYDFVQSLVFTTNPGSVDTGATVVEGENALGTDTCWFSGSPYAPAASVTGGTWTVGVPTISTPDGSVTILTPNQWGPDIVGYSDQAATYYWVNNAKLGRLPCGFHVYQNLTLACPGSGAVTYEINVNLTDTINTNGAQSCREGACGPITAL